MSLLPMLFSDWWEDLDRPHRIHDQHFGLPVDPEDFIDAALPSSTSILVYPSKRARRRYHPFSKNTLATRRSGGISTIQGDKDKFQVTLDVQHFAPEEVTVKVVGKNIVVEANHEEKQDEHGWVSRKFVRKYLVPSQCDIDQVQSSLSSDGVLTVIAPRKALPPTEENERIVKVQFTGQPAIANSNGPQEPMEVEKEQSAIESEPREQRGQQRGKKGSVK